MLQLSVVIITFNEEQNIARCIDSLQGVADEIIVADSFSTDRTESICRQYGVTFLQHSFEGYSEQKNWAISHTQYPYILSLDADEALSPELKKSILQVKENGKYDAYYFNRLTNYCGKWIKHGGWYPDRKLRLWNKAKGKWADLRIHEMIEMQAGCNSVILKGDLLHYSYYSVEQHKKTSAKYATLSAEEYYRRNRKTGIIYMYLKPIWKFLRDYIFKLGFLNGYYGIVIASIDAHSVHLKYRYLQNLYKEKI
jgi:glycosyltransferase involved in cell wall biosynthesis